MFTITTFWQIEIVCNPSNLKFFLANAWRRCKFRLVQFYFYFLISVSILFVSLGWSAISGSELMFYKMLETLLS